MSRIRNAERALTFFADGSRQQYICRTCRAQAVRQFHASRVVAAPEKPFFQRIRENLFGSKESKEAETKREDARKKKVGELAERGNDRVTVKTDKQGREYQVAAIVDPSVDKAYVAATTWDGLERVGGEGWVKARADTGEKYEGFLPRKRAQLASDQWDKLLHHIAVEVQILQEAGRDVNDVCLSRPGETDPKTWLRSPETTLARDENDADVSQQVNSDEVGRQLARALATEEATATSAEQDPTMQMDMSLDDPRIKLTILKRAVQLTGHRIPDPIISQARTLADLSAAFKTKPKPKKLVQTEQMKKLKIEVSNVAVHETKRTSMHKDKELGRWKIIEDELIKRDLPVTGSRWVGAKARVD